MTLPLSHHAATHKDDSGAPSFLKQTFHPTVHREDLFNPMNVL
jgi:hypothetical protein